MLKLRFGWVDKVRTFLREVKVEFKKVSWPARKETIASTFVVILVVFIIAMFLGIVDLGLSRLVGSVIP